MKHPERFNSLKLLRWTDRIQGIIAGEKLGPIRAALDLTNQCSHNCPWCEPVAFRKETIADKNHTLNTQVAIDTLVDLSVMGCKMINISGGGEPTLHPEFGMIIKTIASLGMKSSVVTHGGQLHKWFDDLAAAHYVRVSLDASTPDEHAAMHGTKWREFYRVVDNITEACQRRIRGKQEIGIAYILADCNSSTDSIKWAFEFAHRVDASFLQFRPLSEEKPERFTGNWASLVQQIEALALEFPTVNCFPTGKRYRDIFDQREFSKCWSAMTMAVISANGEVAACCDRRDIVFGNVNKQPFRDIWLSETHRQKAEAIVPHFCGRCLQCSANANIEKFIVNDGALVELV